MWLTRLNSVDRFGLLQTLSDCEQMYCFSLKTANGFRPKTSVCVSVNVQPPNNHECINEKEIFAIDVENTINQLTLLFDFSLEYIYLCCD